MMKELLAAAIFANKNTLRCELNGVRIEAGNDQILLIATDGSRLAVISATKPDQVELFKQEPFEVTIPSQVIASMKKLCGKAGRIEIEIEADKVRLIAKIGTERSVVEGAPIAGNYPNWRAVLLQKGEPTMSGIQVSCEAICAFMEAAGLLSTNPALKIGASQEERRTLELQIAGVPNFYGVMMQIGDDDEHGQVNQPSWLREGSVEQVSSALRAPDAGQGRSIPEEPKFEHQEEIKLWEDEGIDSVVTVGRLSPELCGKKSASWFAALTVKVGNEDLLEALDNDQPCATKRIDSIRSAAKRSKAWLVTTLGKETAEGFYAKIDEAVEAQKEREE